jgi:hypothetical protein
MALNQNRHSCEDFDGECMGWKGFHGNDHDWTMEDYQRGYALPWSDAQADFDKAVLAFDRVLAQVERERYNADDWGFSD